MWCVMVTMLDVVCHGDCCMWCVMVTMLHVVCHGDVLHVVCHGDNVACGVSW